MIADDLLCRKEFDAGGEVKTGSHSRDEVKRKGNGSNYWGDSNLRSWLNSSEKAGNVVWACGNAPTYANEAGFLTNFTNTEKAMMQPVVQKTTLSEADVVLEDKTGSEIYMPDGDIATMVQNYSEAYSQ